MEKGVLQMNEIKKQVEELVQVEKKNAEKNFPMLKV